MLDEKLIITGTRPFRFNWRYLLATLLMVLLIQSCTNSKLLIAPLYNKLDDQMRDEFHKLGTFDESQTDQFEQLVGTFHVWHRQSELPLYAELLADISQSIRVADQTSENDVSRWMQTVERFSRTARECHPVNFSFELMKSLSDEEINFIENRFRNERRKNREKYADRTPEERVERRLKNIVKWTGRINLTLTGAQKKRIREALTEQISLRKEYYALSDAWNRQLFSLARQQEAPDFDQKMAGHFQSLWQLLESNYPEQWQRNRQLWETTLYDLAESLDAEQRRGLSQWLGKLGRTVQSISEDKPSFQVSGNPDVGCQVPAVSETVPFNDKARS